MFKSPGHSLGAAGGTSASGENLMEEQTPVLDEWEGYGWAGHGGGELCEGSSGNKPCSTNVKRRKEEEVCKESVERAGEAE